MSTGGRRSHRTANGRRPEGRTALDPSAPAVGHWTVEWKGPAMSWNLSGSYVETCSCELMCPCNLSFDHGATYDFCRVTLAFHIREGNIDGTDVGGMKVVAIADTPKVMTDGNWKLGVFVDEN